MADTDPTFIVECYLPRVDAAAVEAAGERARVAVDGLRAEGREVLYRGALLVAADEVVFHVFRGADIEVVAEASRRAALGFERVVRYVEVPPQPWAIGAPVGADGATEPGGER